MNYWLLKSEPDSFSVADFDQLPRKTTCWDGVRNYQSRNTLRDSMKVADEAFIYHSSCATPGIAGIARVVREGYPDTTAFDKRHPHYDADSDPAKPRWFMVDLQLVRRMRRVITLDELRQHAARELRNLPLLRTGNRLSVTPVAATEWRFILTLE
jgi:predicted RNA-binding protein with PUA-like domain